MTQTILKKNGKSNKTTLSKVLGKSGNKKPSKAPASKPVKKPTAPKMPGEWLYLNKEELSLRKIYELFEEKQTAEYWEAAGVLEISLPESGTLDMEDLEGTLGDEEGDAYLKENEIQTVCHYIPLHTAPAGIKYGRFHGEDRYTTKESERLMRLPMHYALTDEDVECVIEKIKEFYK